MFSLSTSQSDRFPTNRWADLIDEEEEEEETEETEFEEEDSFERVEEREVNDTFFRASLQRLLSWQADLDSPSHPTAKYRRRANLVEIDTSACNMANQAWSSATTGKPHLSYAERLRNAKNGATAATSGATLGAKADLIDERLADLRQAESALGDRSSSGQSTIFSPTSLSPSLSYGGETVATTASPVLSATASPTLAKPTPAALPRPESVETVVPRVNVWEVRKQQMQANHKEAMPSSDEHQTHTINDKATRRPASEQDTASGITEPKGSETAADREAAKPIVNAWTTRRPNLPVQEVAASSTTAETKEVESVTVTVPKKANVSPVKLTKSQKKKLREAAKEREAMPALSDPQSWPSPNLAKERSPRAQPAALTEDSSAAASTASENKEKPAEELLADLKLEAAKPTMAASERKGRGKQWIAIVPTITHADGRSNGQGTGQRRPGRPTMTDQRRTRSPSKRSTSEPHSSAPASRLLVDGLPTASGLTVNRASSHATLSSDGRAASSAPSINSDSNGRTSPPPRSAKSGGRATTRGSRGRGGSLKASDGEADPPSTSSGSKVTSGDEGQGHVPKGRRGASASRLNGVGPAMNGRRLPHAAGPNLAFPAVPLLERTPIEWAPKGTYTTTEPTAELLWQVEYYFSHHNLVGDFYLRKNMDAQGYVSIDVVASFQRLQRMAGSHAQAMTLVQQTVPFSRTLTLHPNGQKIRKAVGWEQYVLSNDGQTAQQPQPWAAPAIHLSSTMAGAEGVETLSSVPNVAILNVASSQDKMHMDVTPANGAALPGPDMRSPSAGDATEEDDDEPLGLVAATGLGGTLQTRT